MTNNRRKRINYRRPAGRDGDSTRDRNISGTYSQRGEELLSSRFIFSYDLAWLFVLHLRVKEL